jgi:gentisate 1,2-dioxygenase
VEPKYIYAEDKTIKKRCVHVVKRGWAISMITGSKFRFSQKDYKLLYKEVPPWKNSS